MNTAAEKEENWFGHGDFVAVRQTGWRGQIVDSRVLGFNDPEYHVRVWTGSILFKEWFSACELEDWTDGDGENVVRVDFTKRKKLDEDTETGGAA